MKHLRYLFYGLAIIIAILSFFGVVAVVASAIIYNWLGCRWVIVGVTVLSLMWAVGRDAERRALKTFVLIHRENGRMRVVECFDRHEKERLADAIVATAVSPAYKRGAYFVRIMPAGLEKPLEEFLPPSSKTG